MSPRDSFGQVLADAWFVARKDLQVEWRSKEILLTMGYFGFLVVLLFSFSFADGRSSGNPAVSSGILWVAIAFSGTLGLGRVFEREKEGDCLRALMLSPIARPAIYLGKVVGVFVFMLAIESVVVPAVAFFFNLQIEAGLWLRLIGVILLGTVGYSVLGTLLAAMLLKARTKDVLLVIVFYPLILPVLIVGVKATTAILDPQAVMADFSLWTKLLLSFDIVFTVAALWIFEPLVTD